MASEGIRRSSVEVERKFIPTALLQAQLEGKYGEFERLRKMHGGASAAQQPSALSFFRLPDKEIKDAYVDHEGRLAEQGVWIRKRASKVVRTSAFPFVNDSPPTIDWEAKLRMGGDYTRSQMLETSGTDQARKVAKIYLPDVASINLKYVAELVTLRKTYVVQKPFGWHTEANQDGEIRVVLDDVSAPGYGADEPFQHSVGEVELTAECAGGETDEEHDVLRRREVQRMQQRLDVFVARNPLLFPDEKVKGKLEAFFEWREEQGGLGAMI